MANTLIKKITLLQPITESKVIVGKKKDIKEWLGL